MNHLGIDSIGISDTTLEEIFIKIANEPMSNQFNKPPLTICGFNLTENFKKLKDLCFKNEPVPELTEEQSNQYFEFTKKRVKNNSSMRFIQLIALLIKRFHRVKRNVKGFFAEIVFPVVFVCLALLVATLQPDLTDRPSLELHPWYYTTPNKIFVSKSSSLKYEIPLYTSNIFDHVFYTQEQANIKEVNKVVDTFYEPSSLGTRCMTGHKILISQQSQDYRRSLLGSELNCEDFDYKLIHNYTQPPVNFVNGLNSVNYSYIKKSVDCDCTGGFPDCPKTAGGDINYLPVSKLRSKDELFDLSSRNITDWLVKTEFNEQFFRKRFGGFEFIKTQQYNVTTLQNLLNNVINLLNFTSGNNYHYYFSNN